MNATAAAFFAAGWIGLLCGLLGTFVVVRRMALTGDMLAHAVLPGVVAGLAVGPDREPWLALAGALLAGALGSLAFSSLQRHSRLKPDAALALVLSVFFAAGIALISRLQPAGVQAFLFGQIAALDRRDLLLLTLLGVVVLGFIPAAFRVLTLTAFDEAFARLSGVKVRWLEQLFFLLLAAAVVVAMQAVGVILVTAMLVTPAAAARFCTHSLAKMAWLACAIGIAGGCLGVWLSTLHENLPTGPLMALAVSAFFAIAAVAGPRQGWWSRQRRRRRERIRITAEDLLKRLWRNEEIHGGQPGHLATHQFPLIRLFRPALRRLRARRWIESPAEGRVALTTAGREEATRLVRSHRLWERYLTEFAAYPSDHVHEEAERAEHWIDEASRSALVEKLGDPGQDPHGKPIPPAPPQPPPSPAPPRA